MEVWLFLPVLNEEEALKIMLPNLINKFDKVVIIDGHSIDNSVEVGRKSGSEIIIQDELGKGNSIRQGWKYFLKSNASALCMIDADGTCNHDELLKGLQYLEGADVIIGNRFHRGKPASMGIISRIVNWLVSLIISFRIKQRIHDAQTPFWIWNRKAVKALNSGIIATKFEFEVDMLIQSKWAGLKIKEIPISYESRIGKSKFTFSLRLRNLFVIPYLIIRRRSGMTYY